MKRRSARWIWSAAIALVASGAAVEAAPANIRTSDIRFTGTGAALSAAPLAGRDVSVRTPQILFTGMGGALAEPMAWGGGNEPVSTAEITFAGTGTLD